MAPLPDPAPTLTHNATGRGSSPAGFRLFTAGFLALTLLPIAALAVIALTSPVDAWGHLLQFVLPRALGDTLLLLALVSIGTGVIGIGTAWLTTLCDFPGRRFFRWALVLPLAVPLYIAAYSMVELTEFSGPLQSGLRALFGWQSSRDYWFPDFRSVWGAGLIFTLVLYPYVFLTGRLTFSLQGASALDVARSLGAGPGRVFREIGLPMARPALAAGVAVALMETLNDIGAVEYLGVRTLTFAVFETWLNRDSLGAAVQLSLLTLIIIAGLLYIERRAQAARSLKGSARERPPALLKLHGFTAWGATLACGLPVLFGLGVPLLVLGRYALRRLDEISNATLIGSAVNSVTLALLTAAACTLIAFSVLLAARVTREKRLATRGRLATLGYGIPGTVLAIGLLVPLAAFDNAFDGWMRETFGLSTGLMLSGSLFILVYACTLRFLAIAWGTVETGFGRMSNTIDMAARGLGRTPWQMAREVHAPMLRGALMAAFLLVFVDTMKELSATLLLRPFGFETLATFVYARASQAAVEEASWAALAIIAIGLVPMLILGRDLTAAGGAKKKGGT